jgi:outer membrane protein TolC
MKTKRAMLPMKNIRNTLVATAVLSCFGLADTAFAQGPVRITLEQAIQLALQHNHTLQAARTTIQQSQAAEITANLRPNPTFFTDWEYLPIFAPAGSCQSRDRRNPLAGGR